MVPIFISSTNSISSIEVNFTIFCPLCFFAVFSREPLNHIRFYFLSTFAAAAILGQNGMDFKTFPTTL